MKTTTPLTAEGKLFQDFLQGDERAIATLYNKYSSRLRKFAYVRIGNWDDAEDLVQNGFLNACRYKGNFDPTKEFSTWIHSIVNNMCKNYLRRKSIEASRSLEEMSENSNRFRGFQFRSRDPDPDEICHRELILSLTNEAIATVPVIQREVVQRGILMGQPYGEIASDMNLNIGTVKSRMNRGRTVIAKYLRNKGIHGAR